MSAEQDPTQRSPDDLALRQVRSETYRRLRDLNVQIQARRSKKQSDAFDDLLGGPSSSPRVPSAQGRVQDVIKNTKAAYQRLANLKVETKDTIIDAIQKVNLTRFLKETVDSIMVAKILVRDVVAFVEVTSLLFQLYDNFIDIFEPKVIAEIQDAATTAPRKRVLLCIYADLLIVRAIEKSATFSQIVMQLMMKDQLSGKFENHPLIWRLMIHAGGDLLGVNRGETSVIDPIFPPRDLVASELRKPLKVYYDQIVRVMEETSTLGLRLIAEANDLFASKGYTNTRQEQQSKEAHQTYDQLFTMAKLYGFVMKLTPKATWIEERKINVSTPNGTISINEGAADRIKDLGMLHRMETTEFYAKLADLSVPVPDLGLDVVGIKKELDVMSSAGRCDEVARWYIRIDTPERREELKQAVSSLQRARANQAPFFARFVASVSQSFAEVGDFVATTLEKAFHSYVAKCQNTEGVAAQPKLHVARYLAELAKFRIGIASYMSCLRHSLHNLRGRTIDMTCTLFFIAGEFLDTLSDQTHIQIRGEVEQLKKLRENVAYKPHDILMLN
jgi:hypothetical protein